MEKHVHPSSIKPHLIPAILCSILLCPTGLIAVREARKCIDDMEKLDWEAAKKHSDAARRWILVSIFIGIATIVILAWIIYMIWPHMVTLWENIRLITSDDYPSYPLE